MTASALAIRVETDLEALAEAERQTAMRVNERTKHQPGPGRKMGWALSPNIERASPSRERKEPQQPVAPAIAPPAIEKPQPESLSGATDVVLIHGNTYDFEAYRIVEDYDALCEALSERVEDLQPTRLGVDAAGGFAGGHASTLLCKPRSRATAR